MSQHPTHFRSRREAREYIKKWMESKGMVVESKSEDGWQKYSFPSKRDKNEKTR